VPCTLENVLLFFVFIPFLYFDNAGLAQPAETIRLASIFRPAVDYSVLVAAAICLKSPPPSKKKFFRLLPSRKKNPFAHVDSLG
jgi:hypothetical protein